MKKQYVEGSGNIYVDLGVGNPQEARAKADLQRLIHRFELENPAC